MVGVRLGALGLLLLAALAGISPHRAAAQSAAKGIEIIVGMPPGGGVDAYARLVQRHLPHHLKDAPAIVVQNMPGAGSLRSVLALSHAAEDGSVIGTFSSSLILEAIATPDKVQGVDFRNFSFLGNVAEDIRVCYVRSALGIKSLADVKAHPTTVSFAATARGTSGNIDASVLRNLFGMTIRQVDGYEGSAAKRLAIENGEVDGDCGGFGEIPAAWIESGKVHILVRMSPTLVKGLDKQIPWGGDLLPDAGDRQLFEFLTAPERLGRVFMVSSKVPAERKTALRAAFDAMVQDKDFRAEAAKARLEVLPMSGEEVDRRIAELYRTPKDLLAKARQITGD